MQFPSGGSVANPTALVGLTAVNGTLSTATRSDGAPALDQSIAPTWTGQHVWTVALKMPAGSIGAASWYMSTDTTTGFYRPGANQMGIQFSGVSIWTLLPSATNISRVTNGHALSVTSEALTSMSITTYGSSATNNRIFGQRARGTIAAPTVVLQNDELLRNQALGYSGSAFQPAVVDTFIVIEPTPSNTAMGGRRAFMTSPLGTTTPTEVMRLESGTGLSMFGANVVVDANRLVQLRVFTVSTLPSAPGDGRTAYVSDATLATFGSTAIGSGTNHVPVYYNSATANWTIG